MLAAQEACVSTEWTRRDSGVFPGAKTDVADDISLDNYELLKCRYFLSRMTPQIMYMCSLHWAEGGDEGVVVVSVFAVHTPARGAPGPGAGGGRAG